MPRKPKQLQRITIKPEWANVVKERIRPFITQWGVMLPHGSTVEEFAMWCYVQGLMDGYALHDNQPGRCNEVRLV